MPKKGPSGKSTSTAPTSTPPPGKPSSLLDTRVIYCGDNLEQLAKLPDACIDLIGTRSRPVGIDPPFNSNRNYEVFWGETKEKRAFEDRHESTKRLPSTTRASAASNSSESSKKRQFLLSFRLVQAFHDWDFRVRCGR